MLHLLQGVDQLPQHNNHEDKVHSLHCDSDPPDLQHSHSVVLPMLQVRQASYKIRYRRECPDEIRACQSDSGSEQEQCKVQEEANGKEDKTSFGPQEETSGVVDQRQESPGAFK